MKNRFFQWLVGERRGEIVLFDQIEEDDGIVYVKFKDNSRLSTELIAEINQKNISGKMMAEIESLRNMWSFKERKQEGPRTEMDWESQTKFDIPSADEIANADLTGSGGTVKPRAIKKIIDLIPPRPTVNKFGKIASSSDMELPVKETIITLEKIHPVTPELSIVNTSVNINTNDPVYIMMDKAKKIDTEIDMSITISLPSENLYNIIKDSFEDGDKKTIEYIMANMDISNIMNAIKQSIKNMYDKTEELDTRYNDLGEPIAIKEPIIKDAIPNKILESIDGLKPEK